MMEFLIESLKSVVKLVRNTKIVQNPLFAWMAIFWCASKSVQWLTRSERTLIETSWNWILDLFGNFFNFLFKLVFVNILFK